MAEVNQKDDVAQKHEQARSKGEVATRDVGINPLAVPQATFPSTIREGLPGMDMELDVSVGLIESKRIRTNVADIKPKEKPDKIIIDGQE